MQRSSLHSAELGMNCRWADVSRGS